MVARQDIYAGGAYITFSIKDQQFQAKIKEIKRSVSGMEKEFQRFGNFGAQMRGLGEGVARFGRRMTFLSGAMTIPFVSGAKAAAEFERSMAVVAANANVTKKEFTELTKTARDLGKTTQITATEAARGMVKLARAGLDAEQILNAIKPVVEATISVQGDADIDEVTEKIVNITKAFNRPIKADPSRGIKGIAGDIPVLVKAAASANITLTELAEAMAYAGVAAGPRGATSQGFREMIAVLQELKERLGSASIAGTSIRGAYLSLVEPTEKASKALERLGLSAQSFRNAKGEFIGIIPAIRKLQMATAGFADPTVPLAPIFESRQIMAMYTLVARGADDLEKRMRNLDVDQAWLDKFILNLTDNFPGSLKKAASAIENFRIAVGNALKGPLKGMVDAFTDLLNKVSDWIKRNPEAVAQIAALTVAVGGASAAVWGLGTALSALSLPFIGVSLLGQAFMASKVAAQAFREQIDILAKSYRRMLRAAPRFYGLKNAFGQGGRRRGRGGGGASGVFTGGGRPRPPMGDREGVTTKDIRDQDSGGAAYINTGQTPRRGRESEKARAEREAKELRDRLEKERLDVERDIDRSARQRKRLLTPKRIERRRDNPLRMAETGMVGKDAMDRAAKGNKTFASELDRVRRQSNEFSSKAAEQKFPPKPERGMILFPDRRLTGAGGFQIQGGSSYSQIKDLEPKLSKELLDQIDTSKFSIDAVRGSIDPTDLLKQREARVKESLDNFNKNLKRRFVSRSSKKLPSFKKDDRFNYRKKRMKGFVKRLEKRRGKLLSDYEQRVRAALPNLEDMDKARRSYEDQIVEEYLEQFRKEQRAQQIQPKRDKRIAPPAGARSVGFTPGKRERKSLRARNRRAENRYAKQLRSFLADRRPGFDDAAISRGTSRGVVVRRKPKIAGFLPPPEQMTQLGRDFTMARKNVGQTSIAPDLMDELAAMGFRQTSRKGRRSKNFRSKFIQEAVENFKNINRMDYVNDIVFPKESFDRKIKVKAKSRGRQKFIKELEKKLGRKSKEEVVEFEKWLNEWYSQEDADSVAPDSRSRARLRRPTEKTRRRKIAGYLEDKRPKTDDLDFAVGRIFSTASAGGRPMGSRQEARQKGFRRGVNSGAERAPRVLNFLQQLQSKQLSLPLQEVNEQTDRLSKAFAGLRRTADFRLPSDEFIEWGRNASIAAIQSRNFGASLRSVTEMASRSTVTANMLGGSMGFGRGSDPSGVEKQVAFLEKRFASSSSEMERFARTLRSISGGQLAAELGVAAGSTLDLNRSAASTIPLIQVIDSQFGKTRGSAQAMGNAIGKQASSAMSVLGAETAASQRTLAGMIASMGLVQAEGIEMTAGATAGLSAVAVQASEAALAVSVLNKELAETNLLIKTAGSGGAAGLPIVGAASTARAAVKNTKPIPGGLPITAVPPMVSSIGRPPKGRGDVVKEVRRALTGSGFKKTWKMSIKELEKSVVKAVTAGGVSQETMKLFQDFLRFNPTKLGPNGGLPAIQPPGGAYFDLAPYPAINRDAAPFPAANRDAAPFPAARRDRAPYPALNRDAAPFPAASRDRAPFPALNRDAAPFPAASRDRAPYPAMDRDLAPYPMNLPYSRRQKTDEEKAQRRKAARRIAAQRRRRMMARRAKGYGSDLFGGVASGYAATRPRKIHNPMRLIRRRMRGFDWRSKIPGYRTAVGGGMQMAYGMGRAVQGGVRGGIGLAKASRKPGAAGRIVGEGLGKGLTKINHVAASLTKRMTRITATVGLFAKSMAVATAGVAIFLGKFLLIGAAIAAVIAGFTMFTNLLPDLFGDLINGTTRTVKAFKTMVSAVSAAVQAGDMKKAFELAGKGMQVALLSAIYELPGLIWNVLKTIARAIEQFAVNVWQMITDIVSFRGASSSAGFLATLEESFRTKIESDLGELQRETQALKEKNDKRTQLSDAVKFLKPDTKESRIAELEKARKGIEEQFRKGEFNNAGEKNPELKGFSPEEIRDAMLGNIDEQIKLEKTDQQLAEAASEITDANKTAKEVYEEQKKLINELYDTKDVNNKPYISIETRDRALKAALEEFRANDPASQLAEENKRTLEQLIDAGKSLKQSLETPQETLNRSLKEYEEMLIEGAISLDTYNRAVKQATEDAAQALVDLREEEESKDRAGSLRAIAASSLESQQNPLNFAPDFSDSLQTTQEKLIEATKELTDQMRDVRKSTQFSLYKERVTGAVGGASDFLSGFASRFWESVNQGPLGRVQSDALNQYRSLESAIKSLYNDALSSGLTGSPIKDFFKTLDLGELEGKYASAIVGRSTPFEQIEMDVAKVYAEARLAQEDAISFGREGAAKAIGEKLTELTTTASPSIKRYADYLYNISKKTERNVPQPEPAGPVTGWLGIGSRSEDDFYYGRDEKTQDLISETNRLLFDLKKTVESQGTSGPEGSVTKANSMLQVVPDSIKKAVQSAAGVISKQFSSSTGMTFEGLSFRIKSIAGALYENAKAIAKTTTAGLDGMLAKGGKARKGGTYLVGEKGPELFVPSSTGDVIPNGMTGKLLGIDGAFADGTSGGVTLAKEMSRAISKEIAEAEKSGKISSEKMDSIKGRINKVHAINNQIFQDFLSEPKSAKDAKDVMLQWRRHGAMEHQLNILHDRVMQIGKKELGPTESDYKKLYERIELLEQKLKTEKKIFEINRLSNGGFKFGLSVDLIDEEARELYYKYLQDPHKSTTDNERMRRLGHQLAYLKKLLEEAFKGDSIDGMLAKGGKAKKGGTYLVGEKGPELFVPHATGDVIPNGMTEKLLRIDGAFAGGTRGGKEVARKVGNSRERGGLPPRPDFSGRPTINFERLKIATDFLKQSVSSSIFFLEKLASSTTGGRRGAGIVGGHEREKTFAETNNEAQYWRPPTSGDVYREANIEGLANTVGDSISGALRRFSKKRSEAGSGGVSRYERERLNALKASFEKARASGKAAEKTFERLTKLGAKLMPGGRYDMSAKDGDGNYRFGEKFLEDMAKKFRGGNLGYSADVELMRRMREEDSKPEPKVEPKPEPKVDQKTREKQRPDNEEDLNPFAEPRRAPDLEAAMAKIKQDIMPAVDPKRANNIADAISEFKDARGVGDPLYRRSQGPRLGLHERRVKDMMDRGVDPSIINKYREKYDVAGKAAAQKAKSERPAINPQPGPDLSATLEDAARKLTSVFNQNKTSEDVATEATLSRANTTLERIEARLREAGMYT